jgi:hypothetical protein
LRTIRGRRIEMFDFVTGSDLIPDSGHLTGFGIGSDIV